MKRTVIWIDLENTPHVPFFLPIIADLEERGCEILLTARDFAQTRELVEKSGRTVRMIGGEYGNHTLRKSLGLLSRAVRLAWYVRHRNVSLAVGHGSRGLLLASRLLRIPSLTLYDYEGASVRLFNRLSSFVMVPDVLTYDILEPLGLAREKYLTYIGLKESVYLAERTSTQDIQAELGIRVGSIVVTIRPPSETAHYRNDKAQLLFDRIMTLLTGRNDVQIVLLPRNSDQRRECVARYASSRNVIIPATAIDAAALLSMTDLVIGGGGTMNREATILSVPVLSIFKGPQGAVDRSLVEQGKMIEIDSAEAVLPFLRKRDAVDKTSGTSSARATLVETILRLASPRKL